MLAPILIIVGLALRWGVAHKRKEEIKKHFQNSQDENIIPVPSYRMYYIIGDVFVLIGFALLALRLFNVFRV